MSAITVSLGWPWWAITAIASGVAVASAGVLAVSRRPAVRPAAALLVVEAVVIAIVAPFVMSDMKAKGSATAAGDGTMSSGSSITPIHVIEHAPPPHMQTIGNLTTFANPIFDGRNAHRIGRDQGICIHIALAKSSECVWTTILPGGEITAEGPQPDMGSLSPFAITGGTGKYAHARGWVEEKAHNKAGTEFDEYFYVTG